MKDRLGLVIQLLAAAWGGIGTLAIVMFVLTKSPPMQSVTVGQFILGFLGLVVSVSLWILLCAVVWDKFDIE